MVMKLLTIGWRGEFSLMAFLAIRILNIKIWSEASKRRILRAFDGNIGFDSSNISSMTSGQRQTAEASRSA